MKFHVGTGGTILVGLVILGITIHANMDDFNDCLYDFQTKGACNQIINHIFWAFIIYLVVIIIAFAAIFAAILIWGTTQ